MNTTKSRPLAKVFMPVLLLSAALSLPVDSHAAPSPREKNAHADRADKNQNQKQKKHQKQEAQAAQQNQQNQRSNRADERKAAAQRQAELNRQRAAERRAANQQAEVRRQAEVQRQANLKQQFERTRRERQLREARQVEIQRQAELNRRAELQRRAQVQRQAVPRGRYYDRWYDRSTGRYRAYSGGRSWSRGDSIAVDGYLTDEGYSCQALRDDNGELYMLVGNTYGLRSGDHARVVGRVVDGGYCDWEGIAFEITDVTALWADRRHQAVYYHQNYDGGRFGDRDNWMGRRPRAFANKIERYGYYDQDRNRYNERYPN